MALPEIEEQKMKVNGPEHPAKVCFQETWFLIIKCYYINSKCYTQLADVIILSE